MNITENGVEIEWFADSLVQKLRGEEKLAEWDVMSGRPFTALDAERLQSLEFGSVQYFVYAYFVANKTMWRIPNDIRVQKALRQLLAKGWIENRGALLHIVGDDK